MEIRNGVTMAFQSINYKIGDYEVKLYWIDSQSDPEKAVRAYDEAVNRFGIDAGLGGWHSSVGMALMDVCAKYKIPHFFDLATTDAITEKYRSDPVKYGYWVGKWWAGPSVAAGKFYVLTLEDQIKRGVWTPDGKTALLCGEDNDWGRSFTKAIKKDLVEAGWKILSEDYVTMGETDFYPLLTKWKSLKADLIVMTDTPPTLAAWVKQTKEVGFPAVRIADALPYIGEWYEMTGPASDYALAMETVCNTPKQKAFSDEYEKMWGFKPGMQSGGFAYDYANAFIKVAQRTLEKYGKLDKETLYKVAQEEVMTGKLTFDGVVVAQYKFTKESMPEPVVGEDYFFVPVLQYFEGKGTVIWPASMRQADMKLPPEMKK
jgi:branched-chain amino acid transport system substrate-binding protein